MSKLKPCPICGSHYTQVRYMGLKNYPSAFDNGYRGECCDCGTITRACRTEADAAKIWNTRAERTCHDETKPRDFFTCSECHTPIGKWVPVYCPKCGAKVVSE